MSCVMLARREWQQWRRRLPTRTKKRKGGRRGRHLCPLNEGPTLSTLKHQVALQKYFTRGASPLPAPHRPGHCCRIWLSDPRGAATFGSFLSFPSGKETEKSFARQPTLYKCSFVYWCGDSSSAVAIFHLKPIGLWISVRTKSICFLIYICIVKILPKLLIYILFIV